MSNKQLKPKKVYKCCCGIFCHTETVVSESTYYAHRRIAPQSALPLYQPVTPELAAVRANAIAAQQEAQRVGSATGHLNRLATRSQVRVSEPASASRKRARVEINVEEVCYSSDL